MAGRKVLCMLIGHTWKRERRSDRTVLLTCRRCGAQDVVTKDMEQGGTWGGVGGGFPV